MLVFCQIKIQNKRWYSFLFQYEIQNKNKKNQVKRINNAQPDLLILFLEFYFFNKSLISANKSSWLGPAGAAGSTGFLVLL